jgi:hypothetical protein
MQVWTSAYAQLAIRTVKLVGSEAQAVDRPPDVGPVRGHQPEDQRAAHAAPPFIWAAT